MREVPVYMSGSIRDKRMFDVCENFDIVHLRWLTDFMRKHLEFMSLLQWNLVQGNLLHRTIFISNIKVNAQ